MRDSDKARQRAEAAFKQKENAGVDARKPLQEHQARERAVHEKTARLRALRLAHERAKTRS
jgi:hypothetical protein